MSKTGSADELLEIQMPPGVYSIREIEVELTTDNTVTDRGVNIYMLPSTEEILLLVNELKACQSDFAAHFEDLTAEELTPTAENYATSISEAITLANDLASTHNTMMAALDLSESCDLECYAAAASAPADACTNLSTLIVLLNGIRLAFRKAAALLDVDPNEAMEGAFRGYNNYPTGWSYNFTSRNMPYLLPTGNYSAPDHVITAEQTRVVRFHLGADAEVSDWGWLVNMSSPLMGYTRMSLWTSVGNGVAGDSVTVSFEAQLLTNEDEMPGWSCKFQQGGGRTSSLH